MGMPEDAVLERAADRALHALETTVLSEQWARKREDVAYFFKLPLALLAAGRRSDAKAALARLTPHLPEGGFRSANIAYNTAYPHYPCLWGLAAGTALGDAATMGKCDHFLAKYHDARTGAGLVEGGDADMFATAAMVSRGLLTGRLGEAVVSASRLLWAIKRNGARCTSFQLRWSIMSETWVGHAGERAKLPEVFYCVKRDTPGQLYFMLGFPAMVLLELASVMEESKGAVLPDVPSDHDAVTPEVLRTGAAQLLAFCDSCGNFLHSLPAHKVAVCAVMAGDEALAARLWPSLLALQDSERGTFATGDSDLDEIDQTAEMALWLHRVPALRAARGHLMRCFF
eukprot:scaffold283071_cov30-Tisochrysis_lutea.AAC.1